MYLTKHFILIIICTCTFVLIKTSCRSQVSDVKVNSVTKLKNSVWILINVIERNYNDSILFADIYEKKRINFTEDSLQIYYYPFEEPADKMRYDVVSGQIIIKSNDVDINYFNFFLDKIDTLVINRNGRHGLISEYYVRRQ